MTPFTSANSEHLAWDSLDLASLLSLSGFDANDGSTCFRSHLLDDNRNGRVFGGQLLGQALRAALHTTPGERVPTMLQVLFLQGALPEQCIDYRVSVLQEGKRFSSRQVQATQGERSLISAHVTLQDAVSSPVDHTLAPSRPVPGPEHWVGMSALGSLGGAGFEGFDWSWFQKPCLELRVVHPERSLLQKSERPELDYWIKLNNPLGDDPAVHYAALAYLSDYWINTAAIAHHVRLSEVFRGYYVASLNHTLWLHRPCKADDWLLFCTESPSAQSSRTLTQGRVYDRSGTLLATVAQECLFAPR